MGIKFTLAKHKFSKDAIHNLHRFDLLISSQITRTRFGTTADEKVLHNTLLGAGNYLSSFQPRYPLAPIDAYWNMEDIKENSYQFYSHMSIATLKSGISQEEVAAHYRQSALFESVEIYGGPWD